MGRRVTTARTRENKLTETLREHFKKYSHSMKKYTYSEGERAGAQQMHKKRRPSSAIKLYAQNTSKKGSSGSSTSSVSVFSS